MTEYSVQELKNALIEVMPPEPQPIPRSKALGWLCRYLGENVPRDRFDAVVDELKEERRLKLGPGRGGTIALSAEAPGDRTTLSDEAKLYPPVHRLIESELLDLWQIGPQHIVEITATQGRSIGRYLHPDLVLISRSTHKYLGMAQTHVHTFEVKTEKACDATAVLEALSQRHRSHFGYVVWNLPDPDQCGDRYDQVRDYAEKFGIGLILLRHIKPDPDGQLQVVEYEIPVHAKRNDPDPLQIETLIKNHLTDPGKATVLAWHAIS